MGPLLRVIGRYAARAAITFCLLLGTGWLSLVVWFHLPTWAGLNAIATGCVVCLCLLALGPRRWRAVRPARWGASVCALVILAGWASLHPSNDRHWAPDVARVLRATVSGNKVHLTNVRDFRWTGDETADEVWVTRDYDLDHIVAVDLALSYWMGPAIAHTLVSFEFDDGRHLVFSSEIRREEGESFSALGGFVRRFESVLVAAEEGDILRVRTNFRGETMHLYRLRMPPEARRALFLGYLEQAAELERKPRFYNTLTSNCTTVVFDLMRRISPGLPVDPRILLSGYLDRYAFDEQGLVPGFSFKALRDRGDITQRARAAGNAEDFSRLIRVGVPGMNGIRHDH